MAIDPGTQSQISRIASDAWDLILSMDRYVLNLKDDFERCANDYLDPLLWDEPDAVIVQTFKDFVASGLLASIDAKYKMLGQRINKLHQICQVVLKTHK